MKKAIVIFSVLILGIVATAANSLFDGMSNEQLDEYEISITHKSTGKVVGRMSRAEYIVVKIGSGSGLTQQEVSTLITSHIEEVKNSRKNRVRVMGGVGPTGLVEKRTDGTTSHVKTEQGAVGGVGLDRMVSDKVSVGGQVLTNGTFTLGLGLDF